MASAGSDIQQAFEEAAGSLEFFAVDDFLYDRELTLPVAREVASLYDRTLDGLLSSARPQRSTTISRSDAPQSSDREMFLEGSRSLLHHNDPHVRTLAMAALFASEEPRFLPQIAAMVEDETSTLPAPERFAAPLLTDGTLASPQLPRMRMQTVGGVAEKLVRFYLERSGFFYGVNGSKSHPGFKEYWVERKDRNSCAGWFAVRLDRATQGVSPLRRERLSRIRHLRQAIEGLTPVDREVTVLTVFAGRDLPGVMREEDLISAGRQLGPDRLTELLRGSLLIDDPDLPDRLDRLKDFVLPNAAQLLRPSDAPTLLEEGRRTGRPSWFIAAAELQPSTAHDVLREAFEICQFHQDERRRTALALWRLSGLREAEYLREWFYGDPEPRMGRRPYRADFVLSLLGRFEPDDRTLLAAIVRDTRFDELDWPTLEVLVAGLNRLLLPPIVEPRQVSRQSHPLGQLHFNAMIDKAWESHPRETRRLLETLASWRIRIRDRVGDWAPNAPPE